MNRLVHRSWGESFAMICLDLSKDISLVSSSTCADRPFPDRRHAAATGYFFRHSHGGTGCGSVHKPFLVTLSDPLTWLPLSFATAYCQERPFRLFSVA